MIPPLNLEGCVPQKTDSSPPSPRDFERIVKWVTHNAQFWDQIPVHDLEQEPGIYGPFRSYAEMPSPVVRGRTPSGRHYISVQHKVHFKAIHTLIEEGDGYWTHIMYSKYQCYVSTCKKEIPFHVQAFFGLHLRDCGRKLVLGRSHAESSSASGCNQEVTA